MLTFLLSERILLTYIELPMHSTAMFSCSKFWVSVKFISDFFNGSLFAANCPTSTIPLIYIHQSWEKSGRVPKYDGFYLQTPVC